MFSHKNNCLEIKWWFIVKSICFLLLENDSSFIVVQTKSLFCKKVHFYSINYELHNDFYELMNCLVRQKMVKL